MTLRTVALQKLSISIIDIKSFKRKFELSSVGTTVSTDALAKANFSFFELSPVGTTKIKFRPFFIDCTFLFPDRRVAEYNNESSDDINLLVFNGR